MFRTLNLHGEHGILPGQLELPESPRGLILVPRAQHTPTDDFLRGAFAEMHFAVLTIALLSSHELQFADASRNIPRLTQRLLDTLTLIRHDADMTSLPLAIFASGDLTPAALRATAQRDTQVRTLVCHGGLIDQAGLQYLTLLVAPLLMLFNSDDATGPLAWQRAQRHLACPSEVRLVAPGEDQLPILLKWFSQHLVG